MRDQQMKADDSGLEKEQEKTLKRRSHFSAIKKYPNTYLIKS